MSSAQITTSHDAIVTEIEVAAPPERVFKALTDPKQLIRWWGEEGPCKAELWEMDARVGGRWRFEVADPTGKIVINGISDFKAYGKILEYDPPRLLAYTWIANWHDQPGRKTLVRWELTPVGNGTRVKVTHSGLAEEPVARKDYSGGWPGVLRQLKNHAERAAASTR
jgi:uncharacterized protein YndB with AHSA1/START domain